MTVDPQPIALPVSPELIALNNAHSVELSWLEAERFASLVQESFYARTMDAADAFLLAFDQTAHYDSSNYLWFRERYPRFVYIDRVVVAPAMRGRGYARRLYLDLFEQALRMAHEVVVCEVNHHPPNPVSDAFHASMMFAEVGRAIIPQSRKMVRYLARDI